MKGESYQSLLRANMGQLDQHWLLDSYLQECMLAVPPCQPSSILLATVSCIVFFHPAPALQHDLCCLPSLCRSGDGEAEWDAVHELVFNHANPSSDRLLRDLAGQAGQHMKGKIKWKQVASRV